jgi:Ca-activated chloride channel family protein
VFTFGVGEELNARLLDRLAEDGRGTPDYARDGRDFELRVSGLFDKVANPVLAELALDLSAFGAYDVYPKNLPDLFKGTQLVVTGRYRTPKEGTVVLAGTMNGKKQVYEYRAEAAKESKAYEFVPRLWAIRKVGYLLDEIRLHGERPELKDEIVALGKKYGIVTPYTSYLVVEDTPMPPVANRPLPPRPLPFRVDDGRRRGSSSAPGVAGATGAAPMPATPPASAAPFDFSEAETQGDLVKPDGEFAEARKQIKSGDLMRAPEGAKAEKDRSSPPKPASLESAGGSQGIAVSKKVRSMKDEERATNASEPARVASGRTFLFRLGGWIDSEALNGTEKQLKIRYLSEAYFSLLKAKPELKAALALGDRVVVVIGKDKSVVVAPDEGETRADKVLDFLK